jgi:hypothetical protein
MRDAPRRMLCRAHPDLTRDGRGGGWVRRRPGETQRWSVLTGNIPRQEKANLPAGDFYNQLPPASHLEIRSLTFSKTQLRCQFQSRGLSVIIGDIPEMDLPPEGFAYLRSWTTHTGTMSSSVDIWLEEVADAIAMSRFGFQPSIVQCIRPSQLTRPL